MKKNILIFQKVGRYFPSLASATQQCAKGRYLPPYLLILIIFFSLPLSAALKWSFDVDQGTGGVKFIAIGKPKALKIHGRGEKPNGQMVIEKGKISGNIQFDLSTLDTGISLRNRHLKEKYLEIVKFPKAEFRLTKMDQLEKILSLDRVDIDSVPFTGILSLHGVDKSISGTADIEKENQILDLKVAFGIKIKDFNIGIPSYAGITVADDIHIEVDLKTPLLHQ